MALFLLKPAWLVGLTIFYPLPNHWPWIFMAATTSAVILAAISSFVWRAGRAYAYLPVGWLWFLGTLVPVIGLVQVGSAALADRYTYFPLVGVFIIVAFGVSDLVKRHSFPKAGLLHLLP